VPNKIVEPIQGTLQLPIRKYAGQTRHCQHKQQQEYEYSEDNLDQRKTPQPLHRRIYAIEAKSQQPPERGTACFVGSGGHFACRTYNGGATAADRSATEGIIGDDGDGTVPNATDRTHIGNIRGVTVGNADGVNVIIDSDGQLGTINSSCQFKKDIQPMDKASEPSWRSNRSRFITRTRYQEKPKAHRNLV
jgi:hypothetical protein